MEPQEELTKFLKHLNTFNVEIQFTIEKEIIDPCLFPCRGRTKDNGKLVHKVYRKPPQVDQYLNKNTNHHPREDGGVIKN